MWLQEELSCDFFSADYIAEGSWVDLFYFFNDTSLLGSADYRVDDLSLVFLVGADAVYYRAAVVGLRVYHLADIIGHLSDYQKSYLLVILVHDVLDLSRGELEDNGVERLVPAEEKTGDQENNDVYSENHIE